LPFAGLIYFSLIISRQGKFGKIWQIWTKKENENLSKLVKTSHFDRKEM
jgi:hypothetical protein